MRVIYLCPQFPREMPLFVRGLAQSGAEVLGVGDTPPMGLTPDVRRALSGYLCVPHLLDEETIVASVKQWVGTAKIDRVESLWEPLVMLAARLREELGVPGMSRDVVHHFRDKSDMKRRLEEAGLRVPKSDRVRSAEEARSAARAIGYPLIIKPIAGAGSKDTYRIRSANDLEEVLPALRHVPEMSVEEYIEGDEFTFDALWINGRPAFYSVMQYHPKPIESRSTEWISPAQLVFADPDNTPHLAPGIELGRAVGDALGMETGITHMEWFLTPKGEAIFGEIGCRIGGGGIADMMNWANEMCIYKLWGEAITRGTFSATPARKYNVAMVFKRALGRGRISRIEGRDEILSKFAGWVVDDQLLPIGARRRNWLDTLTSDGWLAIRHPDYATCREMMNTIIRDVKMYAE